MSISIACHSSDLKPSVGSKLGAESLTVIPRIEQAYLPLIHEGKSMSWLSANLGLAATVDFANSERFNVVGKVHIWSLRTGLIARTLVFPGRIRLLAGTPGSSLLLIAGGPANKDADRPFARVVDAVTAQTVCELPLPEGDKAYDTQASIVGGHIDPIRKLVEVETERGNRYQISFETFDSISLPLAADPQTFTQRRQESAVPKGTPVWATIRGATDGVLTLCAIGKERGNGFGEVGVYRTDTWEKIVALGHTEDAVERWYLSSNGNQFLGLRRSGFGVIGDFSTLEIVEYDFSRILAGAAPAFTNDGQRLRFARVATDGSLCLITLDWRLGAERSWHPFRSTKLDAEFEFSFGGQKNPAHVWNSNGGVAFGGDGSAVAVAREKEIELFHFDGNSEVPSIIGSIKASGNPVAVSDNATRVWSSVADVERMKAWISEVGLEEPLTVLWQNGEQLHPPQWVVCAGMATQMEAIMQRVSGASMGPYHFDLRTRVSRNHSWKEWPSSAIEGLAGVGVVLVPGSDNRELLLLCRDGGRVSLHDAQTQHLCDSHLLGNYRYSGVLHNRISAPFVGRCALPLSGGGMQLLTVTPSEKLERTLQVWSPAPGSWVMLLPDGRYAMSAGTNAPVSFVRDGSASPIEEFDLQLNQPAAVARAMGGDEVTIGQLDGLRRVRAKRLGETHIEDATADKLMNPPAKLHLQTKPPLIHDKSSITIRGAADGLTSGAAVLLAFVNDAPVPDSKGLPLIGTATQRHFEIDIPLGVGSNKIQLQVVDPNTGKSMFETFRIHRSSKAFARRRYVLGIGVSDYQNDQMEDLEFAGKDADDIATVLTQVPGWFSETKVQILRNEGATKAKVLNAREFLMQSRAGDEVILFMAGHGVLDASGAWYFCPADFEPGHLAETGISYGQIEGLLDGLPALSRLVLIDSCHSGQIDGRQEKELLARLKDVGDSGNRRVRAKPLNRSSVKGTIKAEADSFQRSVGEVFLDLGRSTGATVLSASSGLEFAMESSEHRNGLFTHCLILALRDQFADTNNNGETTALELVKHVAGEVSRLTGGVQHPQARFTNLASDFSIASKHAGDWCPGSPEQLLGNFHRWSGGVWDSSVHPRLLSCFAPKVNYFGKRVSQEAIRQENEQYNLRYPTRAMQVEVIHDRADRADGTCQLRYRTSFSVSWSIPDPKKQGMSNVQNKNGSVEMEAEMNVIGNEWKITGLRVVK